MNHSHTSQNYCIQYISSWLQSACRNKNITELDLAFFSFLTGAIFAPFSWGIFYLIIFIIVYELLFYIFSQGEDPYYTPLGRAAIICAAIFGYIGVRTLLCDQLLIDGVD